MTSSNIGRGSLPPRNEIAEQMRRAVDRDPLPPESELLMLLINGASEIERLELKAKHLQVVKP